MKHLVKFVCCAPGRYRQVTREVTFCCVGGCTLVLSSRLRRNNLIEDLIESCPERHVVNTCSALLNVIACANFDPGAEEGC